MPTSRHNRRPTVEFETWDAPLMSRGILPKHNFHDKSIPLFATSYFHPRQAKLWRKLRSSLQRRIIKLVRTPLFERETTSEFLWTNNWESGISFIALAFSASTLFRFPFVCMRFGGGIFFLVYLLIVILVMQPLTFACMIIGRMSKAKLKRYPWFYLFSRGIPLVFLYITLVFITHNNIVLGYSGVYVMAQLLEAEPDTCSSKMKRNSNCVPYKDINPTISNHKGLQGRTLSTDTHLSSDLFFRYHIQGEKWKTGKWFFFSEHEWRFCAGMAVAFLIVLTVVSKNIVSHLARALMYGACFIPILLMVMVISQLCLWDGGTYGFLYYFLNFNWRFLASLEFWVEAWSLAFFSCLPGYGMISSFATYKANVKGFYYVSWLICIAAIIFAGLSFGLIATEVGILEKLSNIKSYYAVISERTALSYVCLSNVLMKMPTKWPSIIFFAYINIFGLWTQIVATEVSVCYLIQFCKEAVPILGVAVGSRLYVALGIIFVEMCLITGYGTIAGAFMFEAHFLFGGSWIVCVLSFIRIYSATRVYGYEIFLIKIELLLNKSPPKLFRKQIRYMLLPLLVLGMAPMTIYLFTFRFILNSSGNSPMAHPPSGSIAYGWILNLVPILIILLYFIHERYRIKRRVGPKVALASLAEMHHYVVDPKDSKYQMFPHTDRLHQRRQALSIDMQDNQITIKSANLREEINDIQDELKMQATIQSHQRKELVKILGKKRAKFNWKRSLRNVKKAKKLVGNFSRAAKYFTQYRQEEIHRKEKEYLSKLLRNYSVENVFVSAMMEDEPMSDIEKEYCLMDSLLQSQAHVKSTVATRVGSRNQMFNMLTKKPIDEDTIRQLYACHIKQLLGKHYAEKEDNKCLQCDDDDEDDGSLIISSSKQMKPSLVFHRHPQKANTKESEIIEYAIKYDLRSKKGILHILVVEGKSHSFLSKLPQMASPIIITMSLKSVQNLEEKQKFKTIVSKTLAHLYKHENLASWFTGDDNNYSKETFKAQKESKRGHENNEYQEGNEANNDNLDEEEILDSNPKKYKQLIARHKSNLKKGAYDFLDPRKVCIVVLETEDDAEMINLESSYEHPIDQPYTGWLTKPTRRTTKVDHTIEKIENILEYRTAKMKGETEMELEVDDVPHTTLVTINELMTKAKLESLHEKLKQAPSDIVYRGDENDDDGANLMFKESVMMHEDSNETLGEIISADGTPAHLKIHSYHHFFHSADYHPQDNNTEVIFSATEQRNDSIWSSGPRILISDKMHQMKRSMATSTSTTDQDDENGLEAKTDYENFNARLKQWKERRHSIRQEQGQGQKRDHLMFVAEDPQLLTTINPDDYESLRSSQLTASSITHKKQPQQVNGFVRKEGRFHPSPDIHHTVTLNERQKGKNSKDFHTSRANLSQTMHDRDRPELRHPKKKSIIDSKDYLSETGVWSHHSQSLHKGVRDVHFHYEHEHNFHHNARRLNHKHWWQSRKKNLTHNDGTDYIYMDKGKVLEVKKKKKEKFIFSNSVESAVDTKPHGYGGS